MPDFFVTQGLDDVTGEPLVQREDDKPETVSKRLHSYETWEREVAKFFRCVYRSIYAHERTVVII